MKNTSTIPAQHYVGMLLQKSCDLPQAVMTPWGEDAAAQRRMKTVDKWSRSPGSTSLPTLKIDNTPMSGFRLIPRIRRGEYGTSDKWTIEDPRGFTLEISSDNVIELFTTSVVEFGEVQSPCVWARKNNHNYLLTTDSLDYQEATQAQPSATALPEWEAVRPGNQVRLHNGTQGRYLGRVHRIIEQLPDRSQPTNDRFTTTSSFSYAIHVESTTITWSNKFTHELHFVSNPNLASIEDNQEMSLGDAELEVNRLIQDPLCYVRSHGYRDVYLAAANPIKKNTWTYRFQVSENLVNPWADIAHKHSVIVRLQDGTLGRVIKTLDGTSTKITVIDEEGFKKTNVNSSQCVVSPVTGNKGTRYQDLVIEVRSQDIAQCMSVFLEYTTREGNTLSIQI